MSTAFGMGSSGDEIPAPLLVSDRNGGYVPREAIRRFLPDAPVTQEQAGISSALIEDLFLRHVHLKRCNTIGAVAESMALAYPIAEHVFRDLRHQRMLEVSGMVGDDYVFSLTGAGRNLAAERCRMCAYAGPAPVS